MNEKRGTTLLVIGMMFTTLGSTIFNDHKIFQYPALILGLIISIYSVFVTDKWRKSQKEIK